MRRGLLVALFAPIFVAACGGSDSATPTTTTAAAPAASVSSSNQPSSAATQASTSAPVTTSAPAGQTTTPAEGAATSAAFEGDADSEFCQQTGEFVASNPFTDGDLSKLTAEAIELSATQLNALADIAPADIKTDVEVLRDFFNENKTTLPLLTQPPSTDPEEAAAQVQAQLALGQQIGPVVASLGVVQNYLMQVCDVTAP
jgi:hypothetical protein